MCYVILFLLCVMLLLELIQTEVHHVRTLKIMRKVSMSFPVFIIGSFSTDDGNGSENVTLKMSSRFFKLFLVYSSSLEMSKVGEFLWS